MVRDLREVRETLPANPRPVAHRSTGILLATLMALLLIYAGCDAFAEGDSGGTGGLVTLRGQVLNSQTNNPVPGAFIRVAGIFPEIVHETDGQGRYSFEVAIDSTGDLSLVAFKEGFSSETITVLAVADRAITVPNFRITPVAGGREGSGQASNITLVGQSAPSIGVVESGSEEIAEIVFQVVDSLGRPVDLDHAVDVRFTFGSRPGGGEFLFPEVAGTDDGGEVAVNLSSGTRAGTVQVVAEATVGNKLIRSLPVAIAIHGGLPDDVHFSIAPERLNFPGYNIFGLIDPIAAFVGDKYGNPVRPGTAVYFTTTGGIIEGSTLTDTQGRGSVGLLSAAPQPAHPTLGPGYAIITATTADENLATISTQAIVLFSGRPVITISPQILALGQNYVYTVSDQNGNALAGGTNISVVADGDQVKAVGDTQIQLDDTLAKGPGITQFAFRTVVDADSEAETQPSLESITISVSGPNGRLSLTLLPGGETVTEASW